MPHCPDRTTIGAPVVTYGQRRSTHPAYEPETPAGSDLMNHWMRTRTIRMIGFLFGLSLVLTACDAEDLLALLDGGVADQGPAAEAAAGDDVAEDADAAEDSGETTDEGDAAEGKSEDREFQCRRDDVREADKAGTEDAGDDPSAAADGGGAPARASADRDGAKDSDDADTGGDAAGGSGDTQARKPRPAPEEKAPSGGNSGGSSGNLSAIEQDIFDRLNATRREAGIKALTPSAEISRGARSWSCDMAARGTSATPTSVRPACTARTSRGASAPPPRCTRAG